ncbi:serine/threonine-protein kinase [Kitasatospora sp. NPDC056783]|uniref:serine/threonine-protein kinase n=1 Tax=Kitasatospora sp. NPDC056783 TaxID=3345943 RepID=UPI0036AF5B09
MTGRLLAGRYELATLVGRGGMGQVWTARDRNLDRQVAVKLLRPDRVSGAAEFQEVRRRFARECRVTARVDHPGLVTVHDAGSDGEDLYLVMRYVQGADLADHLAEHDPYPWPWAVAVAAQLCPVLAAVHALPAVHRDLKPRNIMVRADGTLVVLDLGVASVLDADTTRLTLTGSPIGSPAYMAPEQAVGGAVGPGADLYALGVILHELLSGSVPFPATTPLGMLHRHVYEPPPPLRRLRPEVPEPLEELVLRLLAKDPGDRPADAAEVHRALAPLLPAPDGRHDDGPGTPMDPTRPFRRPYAPWHPQGRSRPVAPQAPADRTEVAEAVREARELLDQGMITQAVSVLGRGLAVAAELHGPGSPVVRMLRKQYAATLLEDRQFDVALGQLRMLTEQAEPDEPQLARWQGEVGLCLEELGDREGALAEYRYLLARLADREPEFALEVRGRVARLLHAAGDGAGASAMRARVLADSERLYGPHHPVTVRARQAG